MIIAIRCAVSIDKYSTLIVTFEASSVEYILIRIPKRLEDFVQFKNRINSRTLKFELIPFESRILKRSTFNQLSGGSKVICVRRTSTEKMKNHPYRKTPVVEFLFGMLSSFLYVRIEWCHPLFRKNVSILFCYVQYVRTGCICLGEKRNSWSSSRLMCYVPLHSTHVESLSSIQFSFGAFEHHLLNFIRARWVCKQFWCYRTACAA